MGFNLLQDYKKKKDGEISQEEFYERAQRYFVGAAVSLIGSTAGAVIQLSCEERVQLLGVQMVAHLEELLEDLSVDLLRLVR